jgi:hypothetical protein
MLRWSFQTQAGPYYDERINFDVDRPEDIKVVYAGCDKTKRTSEDSNEWRIIEGVNPELYTPSDPNDIRWQQGKKPLTDMPDDLQDPTEWDLSK